MNLKEREQEQGKERVVCQMTRLMCFSDRFLPLIFHVNDFFLFFSRSISFDSFQQNTKKTKITNGSVLALLSILYFCSLSFGFGFAFAFIAYQTTTVAAVIIVSFDRNRINLDFMDVVILFTSLSRQCSTKWKKH